MKAEKIDEAVTTLLSFKPCKEILVSISPTPAIIAFIIFSPAKLTMEDKNPVIPKSAIVTPEKNIIDNLSLISLPKIPASAIVSAWNEIGIAEP